MAKSLLIFSVVLMLVTAGLGFMTRGKVNDLQSTLSDTKRNLASTTTNLNTAKAAEKTALENLQAAEENVKAREAEVATQKTELASLGAKLSDAETRMATATTELDRLREQLGSKDGGPDMNVEALIAKHNQTQQALAEAQTQLAEAQTINQSLQQRADAAESKFAGVQRQVDEYKQGYVRTGLQGQVVAYNPAWNFVVLNIGDQQGLKANTTLVVVRGGQRIGRVRVTSVEPSNAIADVLPGSLPRGVTVQPGDTVIFEGPRGVTR